MDFFDFADIDWNHILTMYVVLVVSLVFHEASHALLAKLGGDPTAYISGQVTLNPVPHMRREPFGTIVLPLAALLLSNGRMCFGYASAPYDPRWAERHPKRSALMAAAGPLSNFLLAAIAFGVLAYLCKTDQAMLNFSADPFYVVQPVEDSTRLLAALKILYAFLLLNLLLGMFNLYPLPPLDGAGVVEGLVPASRGFYRMFREQPMMQILTLLVVWYTLPSILWPTLGFLLGVMA